MATQSEILEINKRVNIPYVLTKLGADPRTIKKIRNKPDYRCPCFFRGGDNSNGLGTTYHLEREKWVLTDFTHKTFCNIDLLDFATKYCKLTFTQALNLLKESIKAGSDNINNAVSFNSTYKESKPLPESILDLYEYGLHPYLHKRGYTPEAAKYFKLGYGCIGEMNDRIVIPIFNERNELVSIQGRTFVNEEPRYLFVDGRGTEAKETLYNFYNAFESIMCKRYVIVVEGAPSVWRAFDYGFKNVVCTLSTSVTDKQLQLLMSLNVKIIIAFDYDKKTNAGQIATLKLAKRLKDLNFDKGVYTINLGKFGLEGAIDDITKQQTYMALKSINKLV